MTVETSDEASPQVRRWEVTIERKVIVYAATPDAASHNVKQWINGVGGIVNVVELPLVDADARVLVDEAPVVSRK
jgi:hypothetical protein